MANDGAGSGAAKPGRGRIYGSITETIGDTPLVRLDRIAEMKGVGAHLLAKLEFFNPIGSVKDRIGVAMIDALEAEGRITPGATTLIEPTSGNTGIALAFVAAARGYRLILVMPEIDVDRAAEDAGAARRRAGADRRRAQGMRGAIATRRRADQARSPTRSSRSSSRTPPIPTSTAAPPPRRSGTTRTAAVDVLRLRRRHRRHHHRRRPGAEAAASRRSAIVAVEPEDSPVLSGGNPGPHKIQGIGAGFVPGDPRHARSIDEVVTVAQRRRLRPTARLLRAGRGHPGRHLVGRGDRGGGRGRRAARR